MTGWEWTQIAVTGFFLRAPAKALWLLLPGPWGRAERLLWRHSTWRQRLRLYTRHSMVVRNTQAAVEWRLSRAFWRLRSCVHWRRVGDWIWHEKCYGGAESWMPRA